MATTRRATLVRSSAVVVLVPLAASLVFWAFQGIGWLLFPYPDGASDDQLLLTWARHVIAEKLLNMALLVLIGFAVFMLLAVATKFRLLLAVVSSFCFQGFWMARYCYLWGVAGYVEYHNIAGTVAVTLCLPLLGAVIAAMVLKRRRALDHDRKPSHFPWVRSVFCAVCLSMAVWTWMRYSYAWDVTYQAMDYWQSVVARGNESFAFSPSYKTSPVGAYVCLRGVVVKTRYEPLDSATEGYSFVALAEPESTEDEAWALVPNAVNTGSSAQHALKGRVRGWLRLKPDRGSVAYVMKPYVDTTASRLHVGSALGLAVAVVGLLVFTLSMKRRLAHAALKSSRPIVRPERTRWDVLAWGLLAAAVVLPVLGALTMPVLGSYQPMVHISDVVTYGNIGFLVCAYSLLLGWGGLCILFPAFVYRRVQPFIAWCERLESSLGFRSTPWPEEPAASNVLHVRIVGVIILVIAVIFAAMFGVDLE